MLQKKPSKKLKRVKGTGRSFRTISRRIGSLEINTEYQEIIRLQNEFKQLEMEKAALRLEEPQIQLKRKYQLALKANTWTFFAKGQK